MLFNDTWERVLDGTKTEMRVPIKDGEILAQNPRRVTSGSRTIWKEGNSYAVQPAQGQKAVGRIVLKTIEEGVLGQVSIEDARAEGFTCLEDYVAAWETRYAKFDPNQTVWTLRFEREPTPEERAARKRIEDEKRLWEMADKQFDELTAVGHDLGEWRIVKDLELKNTCSRCEGSVTVSVGPVNVIGYIPLMNTKVCLADYPEQMKAAQEEWNERLASVYRLLLSAAARRRQKMRSSESGESS